MKIERVSNNNSVVTISFKKDDLYLICRALGNFYKYCDEIEAPLFAEDVANMFHDFNNIEELLNW